MEKRKPGRPPKSDKPVPEAIAEAPSVVPATKVTHSVVDATGMGEYNKATHYAIPKVFVDGLTAAQMSGRGMGQWERIPYIRKCGAAFGENEYEGAVKLCQAMRDAHTERGVTV